MAALDVFKQAPMTSKGWPLASGIWMGADEKKVASGIFYNEDNVLMAFCGEFYAEDEFGVVDMGLSEKAYYVLNRLIRLVVAGCYNPDERLLHVRSLINMLCDMQEKVEFASVRNVKMLESLKPDTVTEGLEKCLAVLNQVIIFYPLPEDPRWVAVPTPSGNSFYAVVLYRPSALKLGLFLKYEHILDIGESSSRLYTNREFDIDADITETLIKNVNDFSKGVDFIDSAFSV
ncbi:MAG: hypothetical protein ACRDBQ_18705 [Shewanella sp.]